MQLLDSISPMIELVETAGVDTATEKYVLLPPEEPNRPLFDRLFKREDPRKIYRVRNEGHPRGLAERRNFGFAVRDMNSDLTLTLEIGYRVACLGGHEANVAQALAVETTPGEVLDQMIEGWIKGFVRGTPALFQGVDTFIDSMWKQAEDLARACGLVLKLFLERPPVSRRTWEFCLPLSFKDQVEPVSVTFRIAVEPSPNPESRKRARFNETPATLEPDTKRHIQEWFGASVLRDSVDRQTSIVKEHLKQNLDEWLASFGLASRVEAIVAPPQVTPDVTHTVRVKGLISFGHFQWLAQTTMEISKPDQFLREKKERQIHDIHIWLGEQYPEFFWAAFRKHVSDPNQITREFEDQVKAAVESIGYGLKSSIVRRVLSEVELDARNQYLQANLAEDKFLDRLIESVRAKVVLAYEGDASSEEIEEKNKHLKDLQNKKSAIIKLIAETRSDAKNLLPDATAEAIGAERRTWTAIADESADARQLGDGKKKDGAPNQDSADTSTSE